MVRMMLLEGRIVVILLQSRKTSAAVVLGTSTSLLVTEVLPGVGCEETDMLSILAASLHLRLIVGARKWLLMASKIGYGSIACEVQLGPVMGSLQHHRAVPELLDQAVLTLDRGIRNLCDLVALEAVPTLVSSLVDEINDVQGIHKVDECVSDVAIIGEIDAKIHEIVLAPAGLVHDPLQHCLVNLIGDVA